MNASLASLRDASVHLPRREGRSSATQKEFDSRVPM